MIRYIHIGDQIYDEDNSFAFYDTVIDRFISLSHEQVFDNIDHLTECHKLELQNPYDYNGKGKVEPPKLERLIGLIP